MGSSHKVGMKMGFSGRQRTRRYNLAVFPERLLKNSKIKIYDPDKIIEQVIQGKQ
jgi:hypothetical protein